MSAQAEHLTACARYSDEYNQARSHKKDIVMMTREKFIETVGFLVREYISNPKAWGDNPQLRVVPSSTVDFDLRLIDGAELLDEIAYDDEEVESAAAAQGEALEEGTDYQVKRTPDFYAVSRLLTWTPVGGRDVDAGAVESLADKYF